MNVFLTVVGHGIMPEMAPAAFMTLMTKLTLSSPFCRTFSWLSKYFLLHNKSQLRLQVK